MPMEGVATAESTGQDDTGAKPKTDAAATEKIPDATSTTDTPATKEKSDASTLAGEMLKKGEKIDTEVASPAATSTLSVTSDKNQLATSGIDTTMDAQAGMKRKRGEDVERPAETVDTADLSNKRARSDEDIKAAVTTSAEPEKPPPLY